MGLPSDLRGPRQGTGSASLGDLRRAAPLPQLPKKKGMDSGTSSESCWHRPEIQYWCAEGLSLLLPSYLSADVCCGEAPFWGLCFEWIWIQQAESAETNLPGTTGLQDGLLPARELQIKVNPKTLTGVGDGCRGGRSQHRGRGTGEPQRSEVGGEQRWGPWPELDVHREAGEAGLCRCGQGGNESRQRGDVNEALPLVSLEDKLGKGTLLEMEGHGLFAQCWFL